jgi:[acyl-carrier-protein] S-malonyltransferase
MAPAQHQLDAALDAATFGPSSIPVVANVDAAAHSDGWLPLLSAQLVSPVRWRQSLLTLAGLGADRFVELGPGTEMSGMVRRTVEGASRANAATPEDLVKLLA